MGGLIKTIIKMQKLISLALFLLCCPLFAHYEKQIVLKKNKLIFKLPKKWGYFQLNQKPGSFYLLYKRRPVLDKNKNKIIPALFIIIEKKHKPIRVNSYKRYILSMMKIDRILKIYKIPTPLSKRGTIFKGRYRDPYYNNASFDRIYYIDQFKGYQIALFFNCYTSVIPHIEKECISFISSFHKTINTTIYTKHKRTIINALKIFRNFKKTKAWDKGPLPILKAMKTLNKNFEEILPDLKRTTHNYPEIFTQIASPDNSLPALCDTYVQEVNRVLTLMKIRILIISAVNSDIKKQMTVFYTLYKKLRYPAFKG